VSRSRDRRLSFPSVQELEGPLLQVEDLRTAVSEACINAMEHGNTLDGATKVFVVMTADDGRLAIDVIDEGHSGPPPTEIVAPVAGFSFRSGAG